MRCAGTNAAPTGRVATPCIGLLENLGYGRPPVWLLSITVVTASQTAHALPPATAQQEEGALRLPAAAQRTGDTRVPADGATRLDDGAGRVENSYSYRVALGGALAMGDPGWGTELGGIQELHGRAQVLPWLGVGLAYFNLTASNNEGRPPFTMQAFELNSSLHPPFESWFDPFLQIGALGVVGVEHNGFDRGPDPRLGWQGQLGVNLALPHFAVGVHARLGHAERSWTLYGLQVEGRI